MSTGGDASDNDRKRREDFLRSIATSDRVFAGALEYYRALPAEHREATQRVLGTLMDYHEQPAMLRLAMARLPSGFAESLITFAIAGWVLAAQTHTVEVEAAIRINNPPSNPRTQ